MVVLHIVEPTLADETGHCHSYVTSLLEANETMGYDMHVWLDRRARSLYAKAACVNHPYFSKKWRKFQQFFCLRRLMKTQTMIFIPTAGRLDLIYLHWLCKRIAPTSRPKIFLHFHQMRATDKKIKLLKQLAAAHPDWVIMAPSEMLINIFRQSGFARCVVVPYPGYLRERAILSDAASRPLPFSAVLFAGAARKDKGFSAMVDFVEYLSHQQSTVPVVLQISPPASDRYDQESAQAIHKLKTLAYAPLTIHAHTLPRAAYERLFHAGICLLLYDVESYRGRFSGVALDAFYAGCPVVAMAGTWAGDMVLRFSAGVILQDRLPASILAAVDAIKAQYFFYCERARQAALVLQQEHHPRNTLRVIQQYVS